jgi:hypothetical protein
VKSLRLAVLRSEALHRLSRSLYRLARFAARRPHEADFAAFSACLQSASGGGFPGRHRRQRRPVGALLRLFSKDAPILSIEPNPYHERGRRFLRRIIARFDFRICAAGEEDRTLTLHVPAYRGVPITGEASLRRSVQQGRSDPLIKIDVESFELPVLRGLTQTLARRSPILMVERCAVDEIRELLSVLELPRPRLRPAQQDPVP